MGLVLGVDNFLIMKIKCQVLDLLIKFSTPLACNFTIGLVGCDLSAPSVSTEDICEPNVSVSEASDGVRVEKLSTL